MSVRPAGDAAARLEAHLRGLGRPALIAFAMAGDPDLAFTGRLVPALAAAGADAVELGMPFSDPLADGPTIQRAAQRALRSGVRLDDLFALADRLRDQGLRVPLLLLSYVNPLLRYGLERAVAAAAASGFAGLIVPDLPYEERGSLEEHCARHGLAAIPFAAPTTDPRRLARIGARARGFLYCVSLTGVTGARDALPAEALDLLRRAREASRAPVALGFGIARPELVRWVAPHADAVIVGSALVERLEGAAADPEAALASACALVAELRSALQAPHVDAGERAC